MKHFILLIISVLLFSTAIFGQSCYLSVVDSGQYKQKIIIEVGLSLISQFFERVREIPPSGIGFNDCVYKLTIIDGTSVQAVSISGRGVNAYGDSDLQGVKGLQHALLKAIFRANPKKRLSVCQSYQNILENECENILKEEQMKKEEQQEKRSFVGVWMVRDLEKEIEYYIQIRKKGEVFGCEIREGEYKDDYMGKVVGKELIWESDPGEETEKYTLSVVKDTLVTVGEESDIYERVSRIHPECLD